MRRYALLSRLRRWIGMTDRIWITGGLTTLVGTLALAACPTVLSNAVSAERKAASWATIKRSRSGPSL
jgi:hypothetical protein